MQSMAGKLHRMILTLPPGAHCLAVSLFELMSGLRLPWHRRRTTRRLRADFVLVHALLSANLGRGHYSYAHFRRLDLLTRLIARRRGSNPTPTRLGNL